jgi:hypothetical protein
MDTNDLTLVEHQAFMQSVRDRAPARTAEQIRTAFERFVVSQERIRGDLKRLTVAELTPLARPLFTGKRKGELVDLAWDRLIDEFAWLTVGEDQVLTKAYDIFSAKPRDELADTRALLAALTDQKLALYLDAREARLAHRKAEAMAQLSAMKSRQLQSSVS